MGLACSNIRLLTLTARKADCEYNMSVLSMKKLAMAREQSDLSRAYASKLQSKNITYRADGKYNQMTYQYLMGYGSGSSLISGNNPLKNDNSMILTDACGLVVMNRSYANVLTKVLGSSCMDANGKGGTFSVDYIPQLIAEMAGSPFNNAEDIKTVMDGGNIDAKYSSTVTKTMSQEAVGSTKHDATNSMTKYFQEVIDFYYPIFHAASANGWTTQYTKEIEDNRSYISDALVSGTLVLAQANDYGNYDPDTNLQYFITTDRVSSRQDADAREQYTAEYNAKKADIDEQESLYDIQITDLSTELEAINTEMESVKSLIDDAQKVFEWGK